MKITDLCLRQLQFSNQRRLAMRSLMLYLSQYPLIPPFTPLGTPHRPAVLALPVIGTHHQFDMLLLG
ncbi:MAG: hypothetical protein H7Z15_09090 [Rhizobacter sp.]|nr:hypothetical protein [Rhizobacter sp.]